MNRSEVISFILAIMKAKEISKSDLARSMGVSKASIGQALNILDSRYDGSRERILNHFDYQIKRSETFSIGAF